jgi:rhamnose utilization protein RhaD (predicted bifunctional aldolase and dehydrogenase)
MAPQWDPSKVTSELVTLTNRLGDPALDLVILGEGNTSELLAGGRILVKASGSFMANATVEDFVEVAVDELIGLIEDPTTTQAELTAALDGGIQAGARRRASIEALIHASVRAFAPAHFVAHTHPTAVVSLLSSVHSEDAYRTAAFTDEAVVLGEPLWMPYAPPGIELGRVFHERLRRRVDESGHVPSLILLANHGIVATSATVAGAEAVSLMAVKAARVRLGAYASGGFVGLDQDQVAEYWTREDLRERRASLSGTGT